MPRRLSFYDERTVKWNDKKNSIVMIDQTLLPEKFQFVECRTVSQLVEAIKEMKVRGAPAIGVAGAMGVALSFCSSKAKTKAAILEGVEEDAVELSKARPTAINLAWGVREALEFTRKLPQEVEIKIARRRVVEFVKRMADLDVETNRRLSDLGAVLFRDSKSVLTHCK